MKQDIGTNLRFCLYVSSHAVSFIIQDLVFDSGHFAYLIMVSTYLSPLNERHDNNPLNLLYHG